MAESAPQRTLVQRLHSALTRRARAFQKRWFQRGPEFPAEAALDWLIAALADSSVDLRATCTETLLDYGCADVVSLWPDSEPPLKDDPAPVGSVENLTAASSLDLAKSAVYWYRWKDLVSANAAFRSLESRQTKNGDFPSPTRLFPHESTRERILTAKYYLDAAQLQVSTSFEAHGQELPDRIQPNDGRMVAVTEWMKSLPERPTIADVGCGSGRFLIHLAEQFPGARLTGIDPCQALLDRLSAPVRSHSGTLLRTNIPEASFDGTFAIESLEHCLVPKRGIAELCRIVRPGGHVLIIDKHRSKQALSECELWERWFYPHELTAWLEPFCDDIRVEPVSHSQGLRGEGLFLAASGKRR